MACGVYPDQESNPCTLRWQVDSYPLDYHVSPWCLTLDVPSSREDIPGGPAVKVKSPVALVVKVKSDAKKNNIA